MKVRLDRLGDEPTTWRDTLVCSREELDHPDVLRLGEARCRGTITRIRTSDNGGTAGGRASSKRGHPESTASFLASVSLDYERTLRCTRCLTSVAEPVTSRVELIVVLDPVEHDGEGELELSEEDLGVLVVSDPDLDFRPLLVEQIELDMPMRAVCRKDCAGLCPNCGADLNTEECRCQPAADPRWAALAALQKPDD